MPEVIDAKLQRFLKQNIQEPLLTATLVRPVPLATRSL
jgi:hypothetical protein